MAPLPENPEAFDGDFEIRLKDDAARILAEAAPHVRPGPHGQPNLTRLMLKGNGTPTNLFRHGMLPGNPSLARLAVLHGHRRGIPWHEALDELCEIVPIPAETAAARAA